MAHALQSLAETFVAVPSDRNREAVAQAGLPLIRSLISRLNVPDNLLTTQEDMESVGFFGLLQALDGYNPERGTPFVSYAYGRVRGALVDYLRSIDALPRERRRQLAAAQRTAEQMQQRQGDAPNDLEVADEMGMTLHEYHTLLRDAQSRFSVSLHAPMESEREQVLIDMLPNPETEVAFELIEQNSLRDYVLTLVKDLPERQQTILALYYYEGLTLREIAGFLSLTEARISQILSKTLKTLRTYLHRHQAKAA